MICNQFKVLTTVCRFCEVRFLIFSYSIYPESQSKCYSRNLVGREDGVHFFGQTRYLYLHLRSLSWVFNDPTTLVYYVFSIHTIHFRIDGIRNVVLGFIT